MNPIKVIVFPTTDREKAKTFFTTFLGAEPYTASDYYIGYRVGDIEIGIDPNGKDIVSYVETMDIQKSIDALLAAGGEMQMEPKDVGGGMLVAQVKDADGNVMGFRQQPRA